MFDFPQYHNIAKKKRKNRRLFSNISVNMKSITSIELFFFFFL